MFCGTPSYMSPEIVKREEFAGGPADVWSLGVLLFAMLTGKFPFKGSVDKEVYCNIKSGVVIFPYEVPPKARTLIRKLMALDPSDRPNCEQIL